MKKVAIDFGTTNTAVAVWREATGLPETLNLPGLSQPNELHGLPLIPSVLYVENGASGEVVLGHKVYAKGLDTEGDNRYFTSFKRGIAARTRPLAVQIDGEDWDERRVGEAFLSNILREIAAQDGGAIDELVLTVPVQSFEQYLQWLRNETALASSKEIDIQRVRIVDESTAAALGYDIRTPGELVLVVDFGGGTLDVSLVRLPVSDEDSGIILGTLNGSSHLFDRHTDEAEARVVAKAGRVLGGDDIDHWLLDELLSRNNVSRADVGLGYTRLKRSVEAAKVRLSTHEEAEVSVFDPDIQRSYRASFTRSQLEGLLDHNGLYSDLQKTINRVLRGARTRGIFPEDINAVLLIGGTSHLPSVQRIIRGQFGSDRVMVQKPFEAVSHGGLSLAAGVGLDDFLYYAYGVRHISPLTVRHEWEEIIPAGTRYPLLEPVRLILAPSRDGQDALELVIGEVEESAGGVSEVMFGDRAILMVEGNIELRKVVPLNEADGSRTVAYLNPAGKAGRDRIEVEFNVDSNRTLRVKVTDLLTERILLYDVPVVELR